MVAGLNEISNGNVTLAGHENARCEAGLCPCLKERARPDC
jgi:hypothetical protein